MDEQDEMDLDYTIDDINISLDQKMSISVTLYNKPKLNFVPIAIRVTGETEKE